jgi:hypothetical protein
VEPVLPIPRGLRETRYSREAQFQSIKISIFIELLILYLIIIIILLFNCAGNFHPIGVQQPIPR